MKNLVNPLRKNAYAVYWIIFLCITLPPLLLYPVAERGMIPWIWLLLIPVILGNILVLFLK
jgi:hypothetical protein